jgi:cell shape-determining protein MreC
MSNGTYQCNICGAIGVMSESAMVKMQRERLDQLCLDKEKLQAKCERYEKENQKLRQTLFNIYHGRELGSEVISRVIDVNDEALRKDG